MRKREDGIECLTCENELFVCENHEAACCDRTMPCPDCNNHLARGWPEYDAADAIAADTALNVKVARIN